MTSPLAVDVTTAPGPTHHEVPPFVGVDVWCRRGEWDGTAG